MYLDNEFYNSLFYVILIINIILTIGIILQVKKILFLRKNLGKKYKAIPKLLGKLRVTDIAIILTWVMFAGYKLIEVTNNPVGFFGNLDYLLLIFAFIAIVDRVISMFVSNGFASLSITFFFSEKGIVIVNPFRKVTQILNIKFIDWNEIEKVEISIQDLSSRIWKITFNSNDGNNYFIIFNDNEKDKVKEILKDRGVNIAD